MTTGTPGVHADARILITGANGGMGFRTCQNLLKRGYRHLVLACRTDAAAERTKRQLAAEFPDAAGHLMTLAGFDMNAPAEIRKGVECLKGSWPIDVVFLQAGGVVYGRTRQLVQLPEQQIEKTIFQNVVGGHLTVQALLSSGLLAEGARIVVAGGEGARGIPGMIAKPDFPTAASLRDYVLCATPSEPYVEMNAMGVSKFVSALWTRKVAELYAGRLTVVWFTPGFTAGTDGLRGIGAVKEFVFKNVAFPLMQLLGIAQSAQRGADKFTQAVVGELGNNGDVLGAPEGKTLGKIQNQIPMNPQIDDQALKDELWTILEQSVGGLETPQPQKTSSLSSVA